ncbi:MAG: ATP-binding cassette domain-containing protein [Nitrospirae bacterium]|nr:ATP-binding cassette domain-containing protein [Nitrospirota bacterium]
MENTVRLYMDIRSFKYPDGTVALSDMLIEIKKGEFVGILGSNGSGKTTFLKVMDGLFKDVDGVVMLDGTDIKKLTPGEIYRKVGLVFQNPDEQLFAPTVFEDVSFGPLNMGFSGAETAERVEGALRDVDMESFAKKPIHNLSFGQKKRVCIAGLLAMGHEILLMDEPTAGLDPMGEYRMMRLLTELNLRKGVTIVMATHSVDLVPIFLSRLFILSKGRLIRGGSPEEVFTAPDDMEQVKLRLPHIADMIYRLKHEDGIGFEKIPLSIGEARREILRIMEEGKKG